MRSGSMPHTAKECAAALQMEAPDKARVSSYRQTDQSEGVI